MSDGGVEAKARHEQEVAITGPPEVDAPAIALDGETDRLGRLGEQANLARPEVHGAGGYDGKGSLDPARPFTASLSVPSPPHDE